MHRPGHLNGGEAAAFAEGNCGLNLIFLGKTKADNPAEVADCLRYCFSSKHFPAASCPEILTTNLSSI